MSHPAVKPQPPGNGSQSAAGEEPRRPSFAEDFRRFFLRGLAAVAPTLITVVLIVKIWEILWEYLGQHIIWLLRRAALEIESRRGPGAIHRVMHDFDYNKWYVQLLGVLLAVVLVYIVGLFVANFIGRTLWRLIETGVMRVPLIRAIYPAVKQVTDFVLADKKPQLEGARVVAVRPHNDNIWSLGLVTGPGLASLSSAINTDMVTVFIPSSPTAFSGYVLVVPRDRVVELPLTVEEAMRLLLTGGVSGPLAQQPKSLPVPSATAEPAPTAAPAPPLP